MDSVEAALFTECTGLNTKNQPISFREAGSQVVRKFPGRVEYGDVTLRYGLTKSSELWDWVMETAKGNLVRKTVTIALLQSDGLQALSAGI